MSASLAKSLISQTSEDSVLVGLIARSRSGQLVCIHARPLGHPHEIAAFYLIEARFFPRRPLRNWDTPTHVAEMCLCDMSAHDPNQMTWACIGSPQSPSATRSARGNTCTSEE